MIRTAKSFLLLCMLFSSLPFFAQEQENSEDIDLKYREDQFYIGLSYNIISDLPSEAKIRGLSGGLQFGYLRDMPINENRTVAIAVGAGLALDRFGSNIFIGENEKEESIFRVLDSEVDFNNNRLSIATIEAPIEIRWRNSTPESYKFWRVYGGVKFGYIYYYRSIFKQSGNEVSQTDIPELDRFRVTGTLSFGRSTISLFANYSFNPLFKDAITEDEEAVNFKSLKLGIIFYIL